MDGENRKIRAFIAIELDERIRNRLLKINQTLLSLKQNEKIRMSVIKPENNHITLQFLGNIAYDLVDEIGERVSESVKECSRFSLKIRNLGGFPNLVRPRVIWAGVEKSVKLINLREKLVASIAELPVKPTGNTYNPHLTLARIKHCPQKRLKNALQSELSSIFGELEVNGFSLMQSELTDSGAIYSEIFRFNLK